jgi:hypothetical protein
VLGTDDRDCAYLNFYFRSYVTGSRPLAPPMTVALLCDSAECFMDSLKNPRTWKSVWLRDEAGWQLYERFRSGSRRPTLLPPFSLPPLKSRFRIAHCAALSPPKGSGAVLILGASGAGKTTLALRMLQEGWRFLSDDMTPLSSDGRFAFRYLRPMNVRANTLDLFPRIIPAVHACGLEVQPMAGTTFMVHATDLGFQIGPMRTAVKCWVRLHSSGEIRVGAKTHQLRTLLIDRSDAVGTIAAIRQVMDA